MAVDLAMRFYGHPPVGSRIGLAALARILRAGDDAAGILRQDLSRRLGGRTVTLHASGREALRVALVHLARRSGRDEVIVPAYTCFSVPSAVVAAGLRVRLVDVDECGRVSVDSLKGLPMEGAAALVVCNLFGNPEPLAPLQALCEPAGVAIVDDAAQALGARLDGVPVGARGELGILSFGRGKPLSALGGGAIAWVGEPPAEARPPDPRPRRLQALLRALAWNVAQSPWVFPWLEAIPALRIGESLFDPDFRRGSISGAAAVLAAASLPSLCTETQCRVAAVDDFRNRITRAVGLVPITPIPGGKTVAPRLAIRAPDKTSRDRAIAEARRWGVGGSCLYPSSLESVSSLLPHITAPTVSLRGASLLAATLFTLPAGQLAAPSAFNLHAVIDCDHGRTTARSSR